MVAADIEAVADVEGVKEGVCVPVTEDVIV